MSALGQLPTLARRTQRSAKCQERKSECDLRPSHSKSLRLIRLQCGCRGWLEHANATLALNPGLIQGRVRVTVHSRKIGVGPVTCGDSDRHSELHSGQRHLVAR